MMSGSGQCGKPAVAFYLVMGKVGHDEQWRKPVALCRTHAAKVPDQWKGEWEYVKITRKEWVTYWVHDV